MEKKLLILSFLFFFSSGLQAEESLIRLTDFPIFVRYNSNSQSLNEVWDESNAKKMQIEDKYIVIKPKIENKIFPIFVLNPTFQTIVVQIQIPNSILKDFQNPSFTISQIGESWTVYTNSEKVSEEIYYTNKKKSNVIIPIINRQAIEYKKNDLTLIHIKIFGEVHSFNFSMTISENDLIAETQKLIAQKSEIFPFFSAGVFFVLGFYLTTLYIRVRRYRAVLYFGIFHIFYSILTFSMSNFAYDHYSIHGIVQKTETISLYFSFLFIVYFHDIYLINRFNIITKLNTVISIVCIFFTLFFYTYFPNLIIILFAIEYIQLLCYIYLMYRILKSKFRKNKSKLGFGAFLRIFLGNRIGILIIIILIMATAIGIETSIKFTFGVQTYLVLITALLYSIFMAFYIIQKIDNSVLQRVQLLSSLQLEKKQNLIEREISIQKEREKNFLDIHDETSADLTFLNLRFKKLIQENELSQNIGKDILEILDRISMGIREKLNSYQDLSFMIENFGFGIKLLLLRKYEAIKKIVEIDISSIEGYPFNFTPDRFDKIAKIVREVANNDCKYGIGESKWKFEILNGTLEINLLSQSSYLAEKRNTRIGFFNIQKIAEQNNFKIEESNQQDRYSIRIAIPFL